MKTNKGIFALAACLIIGQGCALQSSTEPTTSVDEHVGASSAALTSSGSGWAWIDTTGSLSSWRYNSSGGSIVVTTLQTGQYQIDFNGIPYSTFSVGHVNSWGSSAQCKLPFWPVGDSSKTTVYVDCYAPNTTTNVNSAFTVFLDERTGTDFNNGAFASITGGTSPSVSHSYNSMGGTNSVFWDPNFNHYTVSFGKMGFWNASVEVTALGFDANRCKVENWGSGNANVKCFDPSGNPVAGSFSISFLDMAEIPGNAGGHAWIAGGVIGSGYTAGRGLYACAGAGFSVTPSGSDLVVSLSDATISSSATDVVPLVTAQGSDGTYCNVSSWNSSGSLDVNVSVSCYNASGTKISASSTNFTVTITNRLFPQPC